jgi:hypothetical protein
METNMDYRAFTQKPAKSSAMGFRSSLVLAKLGFDLRDHYEDLFSEPLPPELGRLLDRLSGPEAPRASLR